MERFGGFGPVICGWKYLQGPVMPIFQTLRASVEPHPSNSAIIIIILEVNTMGFNEVYSGDCSAGLGMQFD